MTDLEKTSSFTLDNKEKLLENMAFCLENINESYKDFPKAYKRNNIYGLFSIGKEFYNSSQEFIILSQNLYKYKLIDLSENNSQTIIENMQELRNYIDNVKTERNEWLSGNTLTEEPYFAEAVLQGTRRFSTLEKNINKFLKVINDATNDEINNSQKKSYAKTI